MFTRAIVRPPAPNFVAGLTTQLDQTPDYDCALVQHQSYCKALEQCGLTLTRLEADPQFPDATFVEDAAVLTARGAILTRPGAPSRAGEVARIKEALAGFYRSIFSIDAPGTLDGGDICEAGDHFLIGISARTNEAGARQLAAILKSLNYTTSMVDIRSAGEQSVPGSAFTPILHLKSGMAYLGERRLAVIDSLAGRKELSRYEILSVPDIEAYAANCVLINNFVLVASGCNEWERRIRALGYQTIALEMSEFQKMDGGLSCLSLRF